MKKKILYLISFAFPWLVAFPQMALPKAALTLHVICEDGIPISGAKSGIRAQDTVQDLRKSGVTDERGEFSAVLPSFGYFYFSTGKEKYYSAWGKYYFDKGAMSGDASNWAEKKWMPWNPKVRLILKKKGEPIPMYVTRIYMEPPVCDGTLIGFDMESGDWLDPYGRGKRADIFFSATGGVEEGNLRLTWSFPNKGDGIIVYPYEGGPRSELRSPTQAPTDGYFAEISVDSEGRPLGQSGDGRPLSFVFRVRTLLDDAGNVVAANYGKIYTGGFKAVFYLNPTPDSRTLEYDPTRNLRTDLKSYEQINEP